MGSDEWKKVAFGDIIELISGGTPKTNVPEYWGGTIPWISVKDFNTGYRWVSMAEKTITERGLAESATTILNQGDIIISARGTVGVVAQLSVPMAFNQSCYGIRGRQGIAETNYLYYALRHAVGQMQQVAHGGVFNTITRDTFKIIQINLPPLPEQQAIAWILGALDNKIELNRRMNRTLEDIARAIFKSWFVDFDPVRAKADGQQPSGLVPHIADLFPDAFQESELGEIPKGWKTGTLSDIAKINARSWTARNHPEVIQYVDLANTKWGVIELTALIPWEKAPSRARRVVCAGDTIVATTRPGNGSYAYILQEGLTVSTGFAVLTPRKRIYQNLIYITATNPNNINRLADLADAHGGAYPGIKPSEVSDTEIVLPSNEEIIDAFETITSPIRERIESNKKISRTLAALRDMLLQKLITGELRVKDADRFLKERRL